MKPTAIIVITASILLSGAAYAGDNESPIRGNGPFKVVHNEPAGPQQGYTVDQINRALEAQGRPPLGSSRVLHDDHAGRTEHTSTITIRSR